MRHGLRDIRRLKQQSLEIDQAIKNVEAEHKARVNKCYKESAKVGSCSIDPGVRTVLDHTRNEALRPLVRDQKRIFRSLFGRRTGLPYDIDELTDLLTMLEKFMERKK